MAYNPKFKLDPAQLELIENALRAQIHCFSAWSDEVAEEREGKKEAVREISELLAHLHHQKFWYRPKQPVPLG